MPGSRGVGRLDKLCLFEIDFSRRENVGLGAFWLLALVR